MTPRLTAATNPRVLRRFVIFMAVATFVMFSLWAVVRQFTLAPAGDFEVRQGDIRLGDRKYDEALAHFNAALEQTPDHRGALMGRALVYLQTERDKEAEAELTYLIDYLDKNLEPDDRTGMGVKAAAYANRGILYDRTARYEKALADYILAIRTDEGAVDGPGIVDRVIYGTPHASTVRKRAVYLAEQFKLPPEQRVLRIPERDAQERMYKP